MRSRNRERILTLSTTFALKDTEMHAPAETPTTARRTESEQRWAGLAGRSHGDPGTRGCPIVLLHGLTFDHHMWDPVIEALPSSHRTISRRRLPQHRRANTG
jgi:pimeloyl-ACP methyl ester carboxylesterase